MYLTFNNIKYILYNINIKLLQFYKFKNLKNQIKIKIEFSNFIKLLNIFFSFINILLYIFNVIFNNK